ncbi:MAG TPA: prolyl oligopeptidase family serine peptidase, partial [Rhodanobacteraceae bacterium]|nr:prolyl oligopeptidase family serine peptidase [Rhodanobacteraceae bacterium]
DPYLWLEDIHGAKPLEWVEARNAETKKAYADSPEFEKTRKRILEVLDSEEKIPFVTKIGERYYNFWKDEKHPLGLWRRTTLAEYKKAHPRWETVLDVDALSKDEGKRWVWRTADCLKPEYRRCLVALSPGGGDANVIREFDLVDKAFVKDGFYVPEAKNQIAWIDKDRVYIGTDFGPGSMTKSSYPRIAKEWKRGTPLSEATTVYEVKEDDLAASATHDNTPGFERDLIQRVIDFYTSETFLRGADGKLTKIDVPLDATVDPHREWLLIQLRTAWTVGGKTYAEGSLLAAKLDDFMAGDRKLTVLFEPTGTTSLDNYSWTRHRLILNLLDNVASRQEVLTPAPGPWKREPLGGAPKLSAVSAVGVDADTSDAYFMTVTGFLSPPTLYYGTLGSAKPRVVKRAPAFFDAKKLDVHQYFVASKDGTRVPYFVVAAKHLKPDGSHPTLLYGYGGFEVSLAPMYSGSAGRSWLERGGVYVIANIRGGGEYGPRWHQAALRQNRLRAYEDFAAVAEDLVKRGITSREHLGAVGGSNGGLLMGNMLTQYPELFGAIVCEVPLLDMKRYTHLSAGASWIAEYGDPDKPEDWAFIKTFSPYHNVEKGKDYPPILFYTATSDDRVGPVQARKMAAKMRDMGYTNAWFFENTEGGHGGAADNRQSAYMHAMAYTFLWDHLQGASK